MMLVLLPAIMCLALRQTSDASVLCRRIGLVILLMLLLSPAVWPWYYVAIIPLAVIASPRLGLLLWTAILPLCYMEGDLLSKYDVVYLVHLPVWLLLIGESIWINFTRRHREIIHV